MGNASWGYGNDCDSLSAQFKVRYLDFGNSENRSREFLVALRSEFRVIPFMAFQCSITCPDHTSFSAKVCPDGVGGWS